MPPVSNANYGWILHMLNKLDVSHGVAGFLLANGALGADGVEYTLRKELIEKDKVEAIIVLPRDMFYTVDLSCTLWIMNMNKKAGVVNGRRLRDRTNEILFMDLRTWDGNIEEIVIDKKKKKKKTILTDKQITEIKRIYNGWQSEDHSQYKDVPELCKSVMLEGEGGLKEKDYSLIPSKYIEFIDHDLEINYEEEMSRIQVEMKEVMKDEKKSQLMLEDAFRGIGYGID